MPRIVLFNWRDSRHPKSGGAEFYTHAFLSALVAAGYTCTLFVSASSGLPSEEYHPSGYTIIRRGSELTCRYFAFWWLLRHRGDVDLVVDEVNTLPFLSALIAKHKVVLLIHQLAREVWWYEAPWPIAAIGYALEPVLLRLYHRVPYITISASSASSLRAVGLKGQGYIIECPLLPPEVARKAQPSREICIGYVGRLNPSKRVDHVLLAFAKVRRAEPTAKLVIVGSGAPKELRRLQHCVARIGLDDAVAFRGRLPTLERDRVMASLDCLVMASVREGWGLVVSEAARFEVPSVAYAVPGLVDSIEDEVSGLLVEEGDPDALGAAILRLVRDSALRKRLGEAASSSLNRFGPSVFARRVLAVTEDLLTA